MKHAREDYNRFQDPAGLIPEDEPVFLLRGQDKYAAAIVELYSTLVKDAKVAAATKQLAQWMRDWPKHKEPDIKND